MEIYTLDENFLEAEVFDTYESLIWTERWQTYGDFKITMKSDSKYRSLFTLGTQLALSETKTRRVMTVETTEDKIGPDGKSIFTVSGRSLESILDERLYVQLNVPSLTDTPAEILRTIFDWQCVDPLLALNENDVIPFYTPGLPPFFDAATIPEFSDEITLTQGPAVIGDIFRKLCKAYDLGYRFLRDEDRLHFNVYTGDDRTTEQPPAGGGYTPFDVLRFGPKLDNVEDFTDFKTIQNSKNFIFIRWANTNITASSRYHVDEAFDPTPSFQRRYMYVDKSSETLEAPPGGLADAAYEGAQQELGEYPPLSVMDGQIAKLGKYQYGRDYNLGDKVEMQNRDGEIAIRRVTESIRVSDAEGERSYPTLSIGIY